MEEERLEHLIHRAQEGDREAVGELAMRYEGLIRRRVGPRLPGDLRRRFDSEDVFQSTIAASLEALEHFEYRGEGAFVAWLTGVAERRLVSAARRHRAIMRDVSRERPLDGGALRPGGATTPTQGAVRTEAQHRIRDALAGLPEEYRVVADMRSVSGLTFREIAERLGLADTHAARDRFRTALKKMGEALASRNET